MCASKRRVELGKRRVAAEVVQGWTELENMFKWISSAPSFQILQTQWCPSLAQKHPFVEKRDHYLHHHLVYFAIYLYGANHMP